MPDPKRPDAEKIIANALDVASAASVITALAHDRAWNGPITIQPSVITLATKDGKQLKISTLTSRSSSRAELVQGGKTVDASPSGTFTLATGKTVEIKDGKLTGGTAASGSTMRDWAVFALMPAERELHE